MQMDLASMVACVWEVQTPTLPTSATARPVSKAPIVRRGWTGAACSHAGMVRWGGQNGQGWGWGWGPGMVSRQEEGLAQIVLDGNPGFASFSPETWGSKPPFLPSLSFSVKWVR